MAEVEIVKEPETEEEKGPGTRSTTTDSRLTGKKLRVSKAEKWARNARLKVDGPYRPVFDVESNWNYRTSSLEQKAIKAESISRDRYKGEDRVEITEEIYAQVAEQINDDPRLCLAQAIMFSLSMVGQTFREGLDKAYTKALAHEDPNKIIGVQKWAFQFLEHMEHLKGQHKSIDKGPKGGPPDPGTLKDPY